MEIHRNTDICNQCPHSRSDGSSIWCSCDDFDVQERCYDDIGMTVQVYTLLAPPVECRYILEQLVMQN